MKPLDLIQELLDFDPLVQTLGWPVNAEAYCAAVQELRAATDAGAVCEAWNRIAGSLGPRLTAAILSGTEWRVIGQAKGPLDDYDSDDLSQAVWVGGGQKVVGRAQMDGDHLVGVRFTVELR